ncbi:MAG: lipid-transfer protein [Acidimicrobiales bacterium]|jgi:acetyl-CoA acetyltransferase|nr:lipid-transfer protein [Acidimicrobiales bacterium]
MGFEPQENDIAIIGVAQTDAHARYDGPEVVMIMECVNQLLGDAGIERGDVGFTIAGSCDYLSGMPFAFVSNVDGMGAWPPVYESHVEMDGAFALFEAWLRLQMGDIDVAMVVGSGKSSPCNAREVFHLQADPYVVAPLGIDPDAMAGIQAQALIQAGKATEADIADVVVRSRSNAAANPHAQVSGDVSAEDLMSAPYDMAPLRAHDVSPKADGAAAILIARRDRALELTDSPVWITGLDHRIDSHHAGLRDLTDSPSTRLAAAGAGVGDGAVDVAELHVIHSHEEIILRDALGLDDATTINPSGGPLAGDPVMATGLTRIIEVAKRVAEGEASRGVAHATSGAALQQNLVCVLEGGS